MKPKIAFRNSLTVSVLSVMLLLSLPAAGQNARISVDASRVMNTISPLIYGSCIEDVNHEIYGGLYDQKIFGESFEEPAETVVYDGFKSHNGNWVLDGGVMKVNRGWGFQLIEQSNPFGDGSVEVDLKFTGTRGENAGLTVRVGEAGKGSDNFDGYEISLSYDGKKLIFGKHRYNWEPLKEADVAFNPLDWTHLKVELIGPEIRIFLNRSSEPALTYTDTQSPLLTGKVGLRAYYAETAFRDLTITDAGGVHAKPFTPVTRPDVSAMWDLIQAPGCKADFRVDTDHPFNGKNCQMVRLATEPGRAGVANRSLNRWGIGVRKDQLFTGRIYLKADGLKGPVTVALQSADGLKTYASVSFDQIPRDWKQYVFKLKSASADPAARLAIWIDKPGTLWIDQVTLMQTGKDHFRGLPYRADIGEAVVDEGLTFMRYGGSMVNAAEYRFKKMIGDRDRRPPYTGLWNKYSTNGFGIEDFVAFCEAAGFTSAFAINIEETAQDAADMVEYLNGDASTPWGRKRAENGHPKPYNVKYIEIGNEECLNDQTMDADYAHYIDRFLDLYQAMHAKDPSVQFIISAWWRPEVPQVKNTFLKLDGKAAYWDYHPWADPENAGLAIDSALTLMKQKIHEWNPKTTLKCAIFEENGDLHNMQRALGHATTLNAVRRHSEFLLTSCPANALQPWKQNDNGWDQGQVFFTPTQVWGMPPYYAQQMASENHLPLRVWSEAHGGSDVTAAVSEDGKSLVIHVVNYTGKPVDADIEVKGFKGQKSSANISTLSGNLSDRNTPDEPGKIVPQRSVAKIQGDTFKRTFPAYSYTLIRLGQ